MSSPRPAILCLLAIACLTLSLSAQEEVSDLRRLPPVEDETVVEQILPPPEDETVVEQVPPPPADMPENLAVESANDFDEVDGFSIWEEQVVWQDWLLPTRWKVPQGWGSSFEVGVDGSEGNSTTLTLRTGANLKRKIDWSDMKIAINYVKSTAESVETKHTAQMEVNHDWLLGESRWSPYAKSILVYDEFRPYQLELTLNAGLGYRIIDNENTTFKGRFGSGASRQFRGTDNLWEPEAMLGIDWEHTISERQKMRATVEYYPEWGGFSKYRVRTDAAWEVLLDEDTNMSLKLGVIDRYDTRDSGPKPNALDYSLLLLWKL